MAWPSLISRTKDWGTETLTDADLESQLDLIITYINDMMDSTNGHKHDATTAEGPKILVSNLNLTSGAAGDILYHNGTSLVRLAKGTALQFLRQNAGLTAPEWATITQTPLTSSTEVSATASTTTTSTSFEDLNSMTYTFTPGSASNKILILFTGQVKHASQGSTTTLNITIAGSAVSGTERAHTAGANDGWDSVAIAHFTTLAASSQTVKIQWKTSAGTSTCTDRKLIVLEIRVA